MRFPMMPHDAIDKIAQDAKLMRRQVWCRVCERSETVANGLRDGWPKCCGFTMTIDLPELWKQPGGGSGA